MGKRKSIIIILSFLFCAVSIWVMLSNIGFVQDIRKKASNQPDQYAISQTISSQDIDCSEEARAIIDVVRLGGTVSQDTPVDVVLTIDVSQSMVSAGGYPPEPLESAKNAAKTFVGLMNMDGSDTGDRVALVTYGTTSSIVSPLISDPAALIHSIDAISVGQFTNTASGLESAVTALASSRSTARKVIVLMSDGLPNRMRTGAACENWPTVENACTDDVFTVAGSMEGQDISLFTIGLGFDAIESAHPGSGDFGRSILEEIASGSHMYYEAPTAQQLAGIYQSIATIVNDIVVSSRLTIVVNPLLQVFAGSIDPQPDESHDSTYIWDWASMVPGESSLFSFSISHDRASTVPVIMPGSTLSYVEYDGETRTIPITNEIFLTTSGSSCISDSSPTPTQSATLTVTPTHPEITPSPTMESAFTPTPTLAASLTPTPTQSDITPTSPQEATYTPTPTLQAQSVSPTATNTGIPPQQSSSPTPSTTQILSTQTPVPNPSPSHTPTPGGAIHALQVPEAGFPLHPAFLFFAVLLLVTGFIL